MIKDINFAKRKAVYNSISHTLRKQNSIYNYGISQENDNEFILTITLIENIQNIPIQFKKETLKIFDGKAIMKNLEKAENIIVFMGRATLDAKFKITVEDTKDFNIKIKSFDFISCNNFEFDPLNAIINVASSTEPLNFLKELNKEIQEQSKEIILNNLKKLKFKRHLTLEKIDLLYDELTKEDTIVIKETKNRINDYASFLKQYNFFLERVRNFEINLVNDKYNEDNVENTKKAKIICESLIDASEKNDALVEKLLEITPLLKNISALKNDTIFINKLEIQIKQTANGLKDRPSTLIEVFKYGTKTSFAERKNDITEALQKNIGRLLIPLISLKDILNNVLKKDPK